MTVHLPADLEASIRQKIASGRFGDETEVIREALDALDAREHERFLTAPGTGAGRFRER